VTSEDYPSPRHGLSTKPTSNQRHCRSSAQDQPERKLHPNGKFRHVLTVLLQRPLYQTVLAFLAALALAGSVWLLASQGAPAGVAIVRPTPDTQATPTPTPIGGSTPSNALLDINAATATQLAALLPGIGPVLSERIVAFREANGPFARTDLIMARPRHRRRHLREHQPTHHRPIPPRFHDDRRVASCHSHGPDSASRWASSGRRPTTSARSSLSSCSSPLARPTSSRVVFPSRRVATGLAPSRSAASPSCSPASFSASCVAGLVDGAPEVAGTRVRFVLNVETIEPTHGERELASGAITV
jgi:hypothetical protein